jgi:hypothetical protein
VVTVSPTRRRVLRLAAVLRVAAVLGLVPVAAVIGWAGLGDLSSEGFRPSELDFSYRAPELAGWQSASIVVLAGLVGSWGIVVGLHQRVHRVALVLAPLVGLAAALTGRVATAGVIGANIGLGLVVVLVLPVAAALLVLVLVLAWRQPPPPR